MPSLLLEIEDVSVAVRSAFYLLSGHSDRVQAPYMLGQKPGSPSV